MLMLSASFSLISRCLISEPCPSSIWIRSIIAMQLQLRVTGSSHHSILLSSPPSIKSWYFPPKAVYLGAKSTTDQASRLHLILTNYLINLDGRSDGKRSLKVFFYYPNMQFMLHPNEKEVLLLSETFAHVIQAES